MEENYKDVIDSLKARIQFIISKLESATSDNERLRSELSKCEEEIVNNNNTIKDLENRLETIQLMGAFKASTQDVKEAKHRIGKIVREIDKCIALLND